MPDGGPWVQMALFCENAIEDKTGTFTLVRVIDRLNIVEWQADGKPVPFRLWLIVSLKAGSARGRATVEISTEAPNGQTNPGPTANVLFESEDRGATVPVQIAIQPELEGVYWFNVRCDGALLTRMPLRAIFQLPRSEPPDHP